MAPSHDPFAPANRRPRPDEVEEDHAHACLICAELAAVGIDPPAVEHSPEQHIGDARYGDVILSIAPPPGALGTLADVLPYTAEAWERAIPPQVHVLHVAERRRYLPRQIGNGLHLAGATDEEIDLFETAYQDVEGAGLDAEGMDRRDWLDLLAAFRIVAADLESVPAGALLIDTAAVLDQLDQDREVAVAAWAQSVTDAASRDHEDPAQAQAAVNAAVGQLVEIGEWLGAQDDPAAAYAEMDALVGGDGPHKVAEYDQARHHGLTHDEAVAEVWGDAVPTSLGLLLEGEVASFIDPGPVPEGHVRVSFIRDDLDQPEGGEPMGYGMTADVPTDAKAAVAFLNDQDLGAGGDEHTPFDDRARLVLAAELTRAPSSRRKTVLDAVAEHLSPAEIEERTRQVDAPEQITGEGPTDGDGGTLALEGGG